MTQKSPAGGSSKTVVLVLLLFLGSWAAYAQAPTGQFTNSITFSPLWDFGGDYVLTNEWNSVSLELVHHANGQITGVRTETFNMNSPRIYYEGSAFDNGRVTSTAGGVGFLTSWKGTVRGMAGGVSFVGSKTAHGRWTVVPSLLALQNEGTCRICIRGHCESKTAVYQVPLPAGMTGNWNLEFTIQAQGNRLTGSAVVALSNGRALNYSLRGQYNPKTQVSTLHLIGTGETRGTAMLATFAGPQMMLETLRGTVLGQKLRFPDGPF